MPQSNSYHDIKGNPINLEDSTPPGVSGYHDATGKPIHVDLSSGGLLQPPPGYAPDPSNSQLPGSSTEQIPPESVAPFLGRFAANSLPMLGSFSPVPGGTALGRVAATGLQYAAPSTFGEPPDSVGEFAKRLGVDYLTNVGIPKVMGAIPGAAKAIARSLPAYKEGASNLLTKNILSQYSARPESAIVEDMAGQYSPTPPVKINGFQGTPHGQGPLENNPVGQMLQRVKSDMSLPPDVARTQEISKIADTTFSDLKHVQNAKLVADPDSIAELGYKKLLGNEGPINAKGILKELGGDKAEVWQEGLGQNIPAFKEAMGEIAKQQEKGAADTMMRYAGHHLIWAGLSGGAALTGHPVMAGAAGLMAISNPVFAQLMKSEYAPVVVAALKATPGSPQAGVINQFMQAALKSVGALATTPDK